MHKGSLRPHPGLSPNFIESIKTALGLGYGSLLPIGPSSDGNSLLDIDQHFFEGTLTDNSPSAGYVAWNDVKITFQGVTYAVADGSTDLKYIYWEKGDSNVFGAADTFPGITSDDVVIAINNSGTHRMIMMRGGLVSTGLLDDLAVTPEKINVNELSAIVADLGLVVAGELRLGEGTPGSNFTGIRIYKSGTTYRVAGYSGDVLQAYLDSDGKLKAGGGNLTLDVDGMTLECGDGVVNSITWKAGGITKGSIYIDSSGYQRFFGLMSVFAQTVRLLGFAGARLQLNNDPNFEVWADPDTGDMMFKDPNAGPKTLSQLAA